MRDVGALVDPEPARPVGEARGEVKVEVEADWSTRRADARRNHERVLEAAAEVFTEFGLDATIPQVAARAGVGKATVYRSYPTKADLVRALAHAHRDWLAERLREAGSSAAGGNAYSAVEAAVEEIFARLAGDRLMIDVLGGVEGMEDDADSAVRLERILVLGAEQGTIRGDITPFDVRVLMTGVARALLEQDVRDPGEWRRYARLATAALRP